MPTSLRAVLDVKGTTVFSIEPTATVAEAADAMNRAGIGALLVLEEQQIVGIITERDLLCRVVGRRLNAAEVPVAAVMTREVVALRPEVDVEDAMAVVTERRIRHLPVLDGGELCGLVSGGDLTRWVVRDRDVQIQQLVEFITGKYPA
jgi:CBS domain-containing protein